MINIISILGLFAFSLIIVLILLVLIFNPLIDFTRDGKVLLWYGKKNRKYIIIKE